MKNPKFILVCIFILISSSNLFAWHYVDDGSSETIYPSDSLSYDNMRIGGAAEGTVNQIGGTNSIAGLLQLGMEKTGAGIYNLSGGGLSANDELIGSSGQGVFNQTGGSNTAIGIRIGENDSGIGVYTFTKGQLSVDLVQIGYDGYGSFHQSGGETYVDNYLNLGIGPTGVGHFVLANGVNSFISGELIATYESIGVEGTGIFTQIKGSNSISENLQIGYKSTGDGTYELLDGTLTVQAWENIGYEGTGAFKQSGGWHNVLGELILGSKASSNGTYLLEDGVLNVGAEKIGKYGTGTFIQKNGMHEIAETLSIGWDFYTKGSYQLENGQLFVNNVILGEDYGSGVFTQTGGVHTVENDLKIGLGGFNECTLRNTYNLFGGTLNVKGNLTSNASGHLNFDNGELNVEGNLKVAFLRLGYNTNSNAFLRMTSEKSYEFRSAEIGYNGGGTIDHDSGTLAFESLILGVKPGGGGKYTMRENATLNNPWLIIGAKGTGWFYQNGGTNLSEFTSMGGSSIYNLENGIHSGYRLTIGYKIGNDQDYPFYYQVAGALHQNNIEIGKNSAGCYVIDGGSLTVENEMTIGSNSCKLGYYEQNGGISDINKLSLGDANANDYPGQHLAYFYVLNGKADIRSIYLMNSDSKFVVGGKCEISFNEMYVNGGMLENLTDNALVNTGRIDFTNGEIQSSIVNDNEINISGTGNKNIKGDVTNHGTIKVTDANIWFTDVFTNLGVYTSEASNNYFNDIVIEQGGYVEGGGEGSNFFINGDFRINSTGSDLWDISDASFNFTGTGDHVFDFSMWNSATSNLSLGILKNAEDSKITFYGDDLYVDALILKAGSILDLNGVNIFYNSIVDNGSQIIAGCLIYNDSNTPGDVEPDGDVDGYDLSVFAQKLHTGTYSIDITQFVERFGLQ